MNRIRTRSALLTRDGDSARPPTEAFSSSIDGGTHMTLSDTSGLILILNFFLLSSSSSESLEDKNCFPLDAGGRASRTRCVEWMHNVKNIGGTIQLYLPWRRWGRTTEPIRTDLIMSPTATLAHNSYHTVLATLQNCRPQAQCGTKCNTCE